MGDLARDLRLPFQDQDRLVSVRGEMKQSDRRFVEVSPRVDPLVVLRAE